jgi:hypothetical protein
VSLKRAFPAVAILVAMIALLIGAGSAMARGGAGHNPATKKLEDAFKAALYFRSVSADGCYPAPPQLAKDIAGRKKDLRTGVARGPGSVHRSNIVYVLRSGSACNHIRMALLNSSGLYVLNSAQGNIRVQGKRAGPRSDPGQRGPARSLSLITNGFRLHANNELERLESVCPGGRFPIGGGMLSSPAPSPDGEGIYPHSYERLGAQRGFHVSAVLFDPSIASTTPRNVTLQTVCARGLVPANPSPHKTVFIRTGETRTATARCPKGQYLIMGGFQRTDFTIYGGNYVTESRADGPRAWRVTGSAFNGSGELTAIAYCVRHKGKILTETSASAPVPAGQNASATTPSCPAGLTLTSTGFSLNGSPNAFYAGSSLNSGGTTTANAFGYFGSADQLTAYGYCMRVK